MRISFDLPLARRYHAAMLTADQMREIAALPDEADFRFTRTLAGETIVTVTYPDSEWQLHIYENGSRCASRKDWQIGIKPI
jgi:hypothetical protein